MADEKLEQKFCEACGDEFGCGANSGNCWCAHMSIDAETLEKLRDLSADCLCPRCMAMRAKTEQASEAPTNIQPS